MNVDVITLNQLQNTGATMSKNPYEAEATMSGNAVTRSTRWMIIIGCVLLSISAICLLLMAAALMSSFNELATPSPDPSQLAGGISRAMIPAFAVTPLGLAGLIFLVVGFVRRRPPETAHPESKH